MFWRATSQSLPAQNWRTVLGSKSTSTVELGRARRRELLVSSSPTGHESSRHPIKPALTTPGYSPTSPPGLAHRQRAAVAVPPH